MKKTGGRINPYGLGMMQDTPNPLLMIYDPVFEIYIFVEQHINSRHCAALYGLPVTK